MGSSFVIGSSLRSRESSWSMGGRLPHGRVLGAPLPLSAPPHVQPLTQSLLTPNLYRACPSLEVLGFRVLCLPVSVPRSPQTLLIRAMGRDFFFCLGICPCSLHCPPPRAPASCKCAIMGGGTDGAERAPLPQAAKGSGQRRHCPPFLPPLIFNKDLFVTEVWPPAFLLPQVLECGRI